MPVTYSIDATRRLIHTVCTGHLNFAEVMDHFRQLKVDPACCGRMDVLLDVSNADSLPESNQIGAVGTALGAIRPKVQFEACGIVAAKDAMFGITAHRRRLPESQAHFSRLRDFLLSDFAGVRYLPPSEKRPARG